MPQPIISTQPLFLHNWHPFPLQILQETSISAEGSVKGNKKDVVEFCLFNIFVQNRKLYISFRRRGIFAIYKPQLDETAVGGDAMLHCGRLFGQMARLAFFFSIIRTCSDECACEGNIRLRSNKKVSCM